MSTNALVKAVQADTLIDLEVVSTQSTLEDNSKVLGEAGSYRELCGGDPFPGSEAAYTPWFTGLHHIIFSCFASMVI